MAEELCDGLQTHTHWCDSSCVLQLALYTAASKAAPLTGLKVRLLPDAPAWQSGGTVYTLVLETSALIGLRVQVSPLSP
jgi:hypothetical protein